MTTCSLERPKTARSTNAAAPTISVITAVYNRHATVAQAIQSVQAQTHPKVEHIIQDGGSNDGTLDVISGLATPQTRLVSAPDHGIYDALNRGIARATGDIIGVMHADDFFASDSVLQQVADAFADPNIDGVYGDLDYISAADPSRVIRRWTSGPFHPGLLRRGWMPPHPTLYLRRRVFERLGTYDTRYQISADYDAILRWLRDGQLRLAYIPDVLVKMRVGGESNRSLERIIQKSREDYDAIRRCGVGGLGTLFLKNVSKISQFT